MGIDPGSRFWRFCILDDDEILVRVKIETEGITGDPAIIRGLIGEHLEGLEAIAAPSGHGLPTTTLDKVGQDELRQMTLKRGGPGIVGLAASIEVLREVCVDAGIKCFVLPSVKHLASVPPWRKINRIDLGTSDKVCSVAYALQSLSEERSLSLDEISFVLVDVGHAFIAMICVENGRIVDGIGGTMAGFGTRASGAVDAELIHTWEFPDKSSIYSGGLVHASGMSLREIEELLPDGLGERGSSALKRFVEAFTSDAVAISTRNNVGELVLNSVLGPKLNELLLKEAARIGLSTATSLDDEMTGCFGAAYLANGLIGGRYSSLAEHLGIGSSGGSVMEDIYLHGRPRIS
jgi:predicted butyrate kinase (DUF1464 family)